MNSENPFQASGSSRAVRAASARPANRSSASAWRRSSLVGKWRYTVPTPTPALRATFSTRTSSPSSANAFRAASRTLRRFRRASARCVRAPSAKAGEVSVVVFVAICLFGVRMSISAPPVRHEGDDTERRLCDHRHTTGTEVPYSDGTGTRLPIIAYAPAPDRGGHHDHSPRVRAPPLDCPRSPLLRAVHRRARRLHRQRGAAVHRRGAQLLAAEPALGRERIRAHVRRLPAARREVGGPAW